MSDGHQVSVDVVGVWCGDRVGSVFFLTVGVDVGGSSRDDHDRDTRGDVDYDNPADYDDSATACDDHDN